MKCSFVVPEWQYTRMTFRYKTRCSKSVKVCTCYLPRYGMGCMTKTDDGFVRNGRYMLMGEYGFQLYKVLYIELGNIPSSYAASSIGGLSCWKLEVVE